jgi:hypothetical protein
LVVIEILKDESLLTIPHTPPSMYRRSSRSLLLQPWINRDIKISPPQALQFSPLPRIFTLPIPPKMLILHIIINSNIEPSTCRLPRFVEDTFDTALMTDGRTEVIDVVECARGREGERRCDAEDGEFGPLYGPVDPGFAFAFVDKGLHPGVAACEVEVLEAIES